MKKFKTGDVVQLASGGPKMTVNAPTTTGPTSIIECVWFAGDKFGREKIDEGALVKADADPGPPSTTVLGMPSP